MKMIEVNKIFENSLKEKSSSLDGFLGCDGTDSNNNTQLLNNEMTKSRAKIGVKRRPSTKRGRQATLQRVLSTQDILDGPLANEKKVKDGNGNTNKSDSLDKIQKFGNDQKEFFGDLAKHLNYSARKMSITEDFESPIIDSPSMAKLENNCLSQTKEDEFLPSLKSKMLKEIIKDQGIEVNVKSVQEISESILEKIDGNIQNIPNASGSSLSKLLLDENPNDSINIARQDDISPAKNYTTNKISVFYDDENDILNMLANNKQELQDQGVPFETNKVLVIKHVTPDIFAQKSNSISSALFDDALFNQQLNNVSPRNINLSKSIFDDGDDDLFGPTSNLVQNTSNSAKKMEPPIVTIESKKIAKVSRMQKIHSISTGLFGENSSDDELFQGKTVLNKSKQNFNRVFEDESDDDDLFGTKAAKTSKPTQLFDSDEEQESSGNVSTIRKIDKEKEEKKIVKASQPKSLFGEEDLDDDLFGGKSKIGEMILNKFYK